MPVLEDEAMNWLAAVQGVASWPAGAEAVARTWQGIDRVPGPAAALFDVSLEGFAAVLGAPR